MSAKPQTIAPTATAAEALAMMRQKNIRHLPVVDGDRVLGMVTDKDIGGSVGPALIGQLTMQEIMTAPLAISTSASIHNAAKMLFEKKATGLLVTENNRLVGIITLADMLKVLVEFLGILENSIRIHVILKDGDCLKKIYNVISDEGGKVMSVALLSDEQNMYSFRLACDNSQGEKIVSALNQLGYSVELD
jgi:acetoin utilization protein AcuB